MLCGHDADPQPDVTEQLPSKNLSPLAGIAELQIANNRARDFAQPKNAAVQLTTVLFDSERIFASTSDAARAALMRRTAVCDKIAQVFCSSDAGIFDAKRPARFGSQTKSVSCGNRLQKIHVPQVARRGACVEQSPP